jgi:hypothetical protein
MTIQEIKAAIAQAQAAGNALLSNASNVTLTNKSAIALQSVGG